MTEVEPEQHPDNGSRYELVHGKLITTPPANPLHIRTVTNVIEPLHAHVTAQGLGIVGSEGGVVLHRDPDTVLAPDNAFVRIDRWSSGEAERHFGTFPPDLAVEVRSPSESIRSLLAKARI